MSGHSESSYETLHLHKEVIDNIKYQNWPLDKKLRILAQAKRYVRKHQSEVENQLKQNRLEIMSKLG